MESAMISSQEFLRRPEIIPYSGLINNFSRTSAMLSSLPSTDLHESIVSYLLKYADRDFLTDALEYEESARLRDGHLPQTPGFRAKLNNLGLASLRMLALEIAATNQPPVPAPCAIIDRDGKFAITAQDAYLGKMTQTLRSLSTVFSETAPNAINVQSVQHFLNGEQGKIEVGQGKWVLHNNGQFSLAKDQDETLVRRHLDLLGKQFNQFNQMPPSNKKSDRHITWEMEI
jgi:hypothetical protein